MKGLLIAGTGTGVGKTFVARGLCLALRRRGIPVVGVKPFETGCQPLPVDALALERAARSGLLLDQRCFFRYRQPLAPAVAAEREGLKGGIAEAVARVKALAPERFVVVETAGGLEVPLDGTGTNLDLARRLCLPIILVGRDALGTLNHTALSIQALRAAHLVPWAIVLSRGTGPSDPSQVSNLRWVKRLTGVRRALSLPRGPAARAADQLFGGLAVKQLVSPPAKRGRSGAQPKPFRGLLRGARRG